MTIAATQRDLPALVAAGTFRADLTRLAVVVIEVPRSVSVATT